MVNAASITLGVLHPGTMGSAVAAEAVGNGVRTIWCSDGRSSASIGRAADAGLVDVGSLAEVARQSDVILCICPPEHAHGVAASVSSLGFGGVYVEANAVSPSRTKRIADNFDRAQAVVDGSLIGSPPSASKVVRFYLAGPIAATGVIADLFKGSAVQAHILSCEIGKASALKMSYSSYQKASRVLSALAYGLADVHGVGDELQEVARLRTESYLSDVDYISKTAARAWRWAPEMREVADALQDAHLPRELADASADTLMRWGRDRDRHLAVADALAHLMNDYDG